MSELKGKSGARYGPGWSDSTTASIGCTRHCADTSVPESGQQLV
jgi:hypothetical protein